MRTSTRDKPFFLYYATGAGHAPHHVPAEWRTSTRASSIWAGTSTARSSTSARWSWASSRRTPNCRRMTRMCRCGTPAGRCQAAVCPLDGGLCRLPQLHRLPLRARPEDILKEIGELDNTLIMVVSDNGASSEGGPVGSLNEMFFFNNAQETLEDNLKDHRQAGRASRPATTTPGAGPTPATRPSAAGRSARRTGAAPPTHASCRGPRGYTRTVRLRPHYGHIIDFVPTVLEALGVAGAGEHPRCNPGRPSTGSASPTPSTRRRRPAITTPSISRCSATARSTTTAGGRSARRPGRASPRPPRGPPVRLAHPQPRARGYRDPRLGAVPCDKDYSETATTWPPSHATS